MRSTIAEMGVQIFSPCSGSVELWNGNIIIKSEVRHFSIMCQKQRKWWDQKTCDFSCLEEHFLQDKKNHKFSDLIIYRMCAKTNHHHHHRYHHSLYRAVISTNLEDRYFFLLRRILSHVWSLVALTVALLTSIWLCELRCQSETWSCDIYHYRVVIKV